MNTPAQFLAAYYRSLARFQDDEGEVREGQFRAYDECKADWGEEALGMIEVIADREAAGPVPDIDLELVDQLISDAVQYRRGDADEDDPGVAEVMFARTTEQGTAMAETAICGDCRVAVAELPDGTHGVRLQDLVDCSGNDALSCNVCGKVTMDVDEADDLATADKFGQLGEDLKTAVAVALRDSAVLDQLNLLLSAEEWPGASGMEDVAEIVRATGRTQIPDAPEWGRH